jgi:hypothetical protein
VAGAAEMLVGELASGMVGNGLLSGGSTSEQHGGQREQSVGATREPHVTRYIDPRRPTSLAIQSPEGH